LQVDFGIWTPDQKQVAKEKVSSRLVSVAWSSDGNFLALGHLNGTVSIRSSKAEELMKIEKRAPVWCLAFIPEPQATSRVHHAQIGNNSSNNNNNNNNNTGGANFDHADNVVIGCWDKTYSLYRLTPRGALLLTEKKLAYYPLCIRSVNNYVTKTNFMVVTGSNKQVQILSRDGVKLADVIPFNHLPSSWVWCADCSAEDETLVYATNHGLIEFMKTKFDSVHSLCNDRFAFRENLTEVIVHHLVTDKKVRIKCKDMIHNLSLFRNKLAVQLLDRICVYESSVDDTTDIHFRLRKERITLMSGSFNLESKAVSNLMVVTSMHIFTCLQQYLELYHQNGYRQRLWKLESEVLYMMVDGGQDGKEGVLIGLANGKVMKFFVDEAFPVEFAQRKYGIIYTAQNVYRTLIATIDTNHQLVISEVSTQEVIFSVNDVLAACFNTEMEDLMAITHMNNAISVISGLISIDQASMMGGSMKSISSGSGKKTTNPELEEQHLLGKVVGFSGQKIYSTQRGVLTSIDIPQEKNIAKALEISDYQSAYKIACMGATESDWRLLAMKALRANQLHVAKNSFARLKDIRYLSLIENIERSSSSYGGPATTDSTSSSAAAASNNAAKDVMSRARGKAAATTNPIVPSTNSNNTGGLKQPSLSALEPRWLAEIMAYEGHFHEAAKLFARSGNVDASIQMFTLLRKYEDAKNFARSTNSHSADIAELTVQQAKWLEEIKDWKGASELLMSMGQYHQAARIIGENNASSSPQTGVDKDGKAVANEANKNMKRGWQLVMMEVVRGCPQDDKETLLYCAEKLSKLEDISYAKEAYLKANDYAKLMALYVNREMWTEAAKLADDYAGKFDMSVFASYAEWLISQDRYEEAMEAYKKSGRMDLSRKVLTELTYNAVSEHRFKDAGYYYWMLAKELEAEITEIQKNSNNNSITNSTNNETALMEVTHAKTILLSECEHKADLYYAYSIIYSYVIDPFTTYQPEMLFQVARFIINSLGISDSIPQGISKTFTLYTLAKQAMQLGAFKLARNAYDRLSRLKIPDRKLEEVELEMLLVQAKPVRDDPDHLPVCYRCGSVNPLLNPFTNRFAKGDVCTNCGHPFVRSFINFDILPLVEFVPEPSISDDEAIEMIRQPASRSQLFRSNSVESKSNDGGRKGSNNNQVNIISFSEDNDQSMLGDQEAHDLFTQCLNITLDRQV
jgi:intraflagellar transport protein 122